MADNTISVSLEIETEKGKKQVEGALKGITVAAKDTGTVIEREVSDSFNSAGKSASNFGDIVKGVFVGNLAANFAASILSSIKGAFDVGIQSALDQEKANQRLAFSLQQTGEYSESTYNSILDFANAMEELSNVSDDVIIKGVATAQTFGASADQAKQATTAALGLSKALGVDFDTALLQVSTTLSGDAGRLGKYSEELKGLSKEALQSGQGIEVLANQFGKFAGADLNTTSGQLSSLGTAFGNLAEEIASIFTSSSLLASAGSIIKNFVNGVTDAIKTSKEFFSGPEGIDGLRQRLQEIQPEIDEIRKKISTLSPESKGMIIAFKSQIGELMLERNRLTESIKQAEAQEAQAAANSAKIRQDAINQSLAAKASADNKLILSEYAKEQQILQARSIGQTNEMLLLENKFAQENIALVTAFQNNLLTEEQYLIQRDQLQANYDLARQQRAMAADQSLVVSFQNAAMSMKMTMGDLAKNATNIMANGFGRAFQNMGAAMAQGQSAFKAFGDAVKGLLADLASAVGDYFIKTGIAVAFTPPQFGGNPAQGAAMIAAGAAIKAFAGFLGASGGGTATQGGGVAPSGATLVSPEAGATIAQQELVEQGPRVNVTIQGNVLDSQESGLRIVQLINDAFDQSGAVLTPRGA